MPALLEIVAIALAAGWAFAAPALGQERKTSPLASHLPLGTAACFGRVYDASHLQRHPKQRVTSFHLFRDFAIDPGAEYVVATREQLIADDGTNGTVPVNAFVRFRDRPGLFYNALICTRSGDTVRCGVECDGGGFKLRASGPALLIENEGFVVVGGCGASDDEQEQSDFVAPGDDDRVFRLDPQQVGECAALREALKPSWARLGAPLRVRLDRDETVCFSRRYGADHLGRHPGQSVRHIAVVKPAGGRPMQDAGAYRLTFRVELTDGRRFEKTTTCQPSKYAYGCTHDPALDAQEDFYLTRSGERHIMLRDRKGKLADLFGARLGADDRMFRLEAAPASTCAF
jgi:hypothetical protein